MKYFLDTNVVVATSTNMAIMKHDTSTDWNVRNSFALGADFLTVITFFITLCTLLTVRRYQSKVIDVSIIFDNLEHLKKIENSLNKFHKNNQKYPLPSDLLDNLKKHTDKLVKYGKLLGKRKYKKEVNAIMDIKLISVTNAGQIINDIEAIIRIVENDK